GRTGPGDDAAARGRPRRGRRRRRHRGDGARRPGPARGVRPPAGHHGPRDRRDPRLRRQRARGRRRLAPAARRRRLGAPHRARAARPVLVRALGLRLVRRHRAPRAAAGARPGAPARPRVLRRHPDHGARPVPRPRRHPAAVALAPRPAAHELRPARHLRGRGRRREHAHRPRGV
ncbi:MAG: hypothetical protein AVDCRST_MAG54-550, partial [uncultured Actinomycetospora sp.]